MTNSWCHKIYTAIYHAAVDVWCNIANLITFFALTTLANWKWSDEWHASAWSCSSSYWEAGSVKITSSRITSDSTRKKYVLLYLDKKKVIWRFFISKKIETDEIFSRFKFQILVNQIFETIKVWALFRGIIRKQLFSMYLSCLQTIKYLMRN